MRYFLGLISFITTITFAVESQSTRFQIENFTPQGTAKDIQQVSARFTAPMVAFGDPRLDDPFEINCAQKGKGRWVDSQNWIYDFEKTLPAGVNCHFKLKPDVHSLSNGAIDGPSEFGFNTGGPSVKVAMPSDGETSIDEQQIFLLATDAPTDSNSILTQARCEIEGINERIGVRLLEGDEREQVLAQRRLLGYSFYQLLSQYETKPILSIEERNQAEAQLVVLQCQRTLPPDTNVRIIWANGIKTQSGIPSSADQILSYRSRSHFTANFTCPRTKEDANCLPMLPMQINLSASIPVENAEKIQLKGEDGKLYPMNPFNHQESPWVQTVKFNPPFPENASFLVELPADLQDDSGRSLNNTAQFPLTVKTDEAPPLAKFAAKFGIIEWSQESALPVSLRNLEATITAKQQSLPSESQTAAIPGTIKRLEKDDVEIIEWLKKVEHADDYTDKPDPKNAELRTNITGTKSIFDANFPGQPLEIPKSLGEKEFEVVGIPLPKPGFYVIELASPKLGAALLGLERPRYVSSAALVTNLSAHFKWGRESSLVWVTTLADAKPVANADIAIRECDGHLLWQGPTNQEGIADIPGDAIPAQDKLHNCESDWGQNLFISARTKEDMTFVLSRWNDGIAPWDFNLNNAMSHSSILAHTVFDRMLFRAGETVHMKHWFRQHTSHGFAIPSAITTNKSAKLSITHIGSDQNFELPITWDDKGLAETDWEIPKDAKLGEYQVTIKQGDENFSSGHFRVEEFRVPTMKALVQAPGEPAVNKRELQVDLMVSYLSGGGVSNLPVKLRTKIRPRSVSFPDYDSFSFTQETIEEGVQTIPTDAYFDETGAPVNPSVRQQPAQVLPLKLDAAGSLRAKIPNLPLITTPQELLAELEYQDANGEILTVSNRIPLWPAKLNVGIKTEGWVAQKEHVKFQVVALDLQGKPVKNQSINVKIYKKSNYSHRKRLIGGFYGYEDSTAVERVGQQCNGDTDEHGLIFCDVPTKETGELILQAETKDDLGNLTHATSTVWVSGEEDWWFKPADHDRIELLPEQKRYEPHQTAKFQVRMPFREATALVTIEREGVTDRFVTQLSGKEPIIEVPLKGHYAPNVFVSVLAVRGRVGDIQPTALLDLGKPAYKLGIAEIKVGWQAHELKVDVQANKPQYKVRDTAKIKVTVVKANGEALANSQAEIALAAVDEGLLELMPNSSWEILEAMMQSRGIEVITSTAQMQVVGKRHFGRKAVPPGGGGGQQAGRELFDTLLLWKARVTLDENGISEIEVPLNDALTGFKIVAIANAENGFFGTGSTTIRSSQDLMLHSGLSPIVREDDHFSGIVNVRNASDHSMQVKIFAQAHILAAELEPLRNLELAPQEINLAAGAAQIVSWPVKVPLDAQQLKWQFTAQEKDAEAKDQLNVTQQVLTSVPIRVFQATVSQINKSEHIDVAIPKDAIPGRGGIHINLRKSISDDVDGLVEYMQNYPYACLEQRVSKAIALDDASLWDKTMQQIPTYQDSDGLLKFFPTQWLQGDDHLTAYILAISHEKGWQLPEKVLQSSKDGLKRFISGSIKRYSSISVADLALRKLSAIAALARYGEATADMLSSIPVDPNLWPTIAVVDWLEILDHVKNIPQSSRQMKEAQNILRSRFYLQGTSMTLSKPVHDQLWWLMSSADLVANRVILATLSKKGWKTDLPRLLRGALSRQQRGHWDTTPANAWGRLALEKFGKAFESTAITGETKLVLDDQEMINEWQAGSEGTELEFTWPNNEAASQLQVEHLGSGKPWLFLQSKAAIPMKEALTSGFTIKRTIIPVEQKTANVWTKGDVMRISLEMESQTDMNWVVVNDPIPAGAGLLGGGLGRDTQVLISEAQPDAWLFPTFEERHFDNYRAYFAFVPKGKFTVEYTLRLNNPGLFVMPATRVEAMYLPEMFAELPNKKLEINVGP